MEIEQSVEYIQLKRIFDELFDRVAQRVVVVPKIEKPKTELQIQNMKKKTLMEKLMKSQACIFLYASLLFPLRRRAKTEIVKSRNYISDDIFSTHLYLRGVS
jgi:U3 small nucleolar ribonucleoprotein component